MHSLWLIGGQIKKTPPANSREPNHLEEELQDDKRRSVDEFPVLIPTRLSGMTLTSFADRENSSRAFPPRQRATLRPSPHARLPGCDGLDR